jgi:hypothetical protein
MLPPHAFSFNCKICAGKIQITQAQLDAIHSGVKDKKAADKDTKKKKAKASLGKIQAVNLKKLQGKLSDFLADLSERSERDWILMLTKYVAYFSIGLLVVLIGIGGVDYLSIGNNKTVTYAEVERSLDLKMDPLLTIQAAVPDIKIPNTVAKYLGGENRATFVEWINGLPQKQKKDFIKNLDLIIRQAQKRDPEHIFEYINEYKSLKFKQSSVSPVAKYLMKLGLIVVLITMIVLLGLFSMLLLRLSSRKTVS